MKRAKQQDLTQDKTCVIYLSKDMNAKCPKNNNALPTMTFRSSVHEEFIKKEHTLSQFQKTNMI